jgi:hypothetical protein
VCVLLSEQVAAGSAGSDAAAKPGAGAGAALGCQGAAPVSMLWRFHRGCVPRRPAFVLTLQNIQNLPTNDEITQAVLWIWSLGYTGHNCPANLDLHPPRSTAAAAAAAAAHFLFRSLELAQEEVIPCFSTTKDH